jgi:8-oxo-dGTP pyrophosphatase MutT (NUDIX family)
MHWLNFTGALPRLLGDPLPGPEAQYRMAHIGRPYQAVAPPGDAREAAVLLLVYPWQGQAHTVLIRRSGRDERDIHKGQISLPGGKREAFDPDLSASALREAEEEVGVPRHAVQLQCALTPLYIPVSNFLVHPFFGVTDRRPDFIPQESEVEEILEVPLARFLLPEIRKRADIPVGTGLVLQDVPYYDVQGQILWGATAMIMSEFLEWWGAIPGRG